MSFEPANSIQSFIPNDLIVPDDYEDAQIILTDHFRRSTEALNLKEIGDYQDVEIVNGQRWFIPDDNQNFRYGSRKVIDFGTLPNAGTGSVAHGINVTANTRFTRIYGTASDPSTRFIPIPYVNVATPGDGVELDVDATNVNITTTTANYVGFTDTYVIIEWVENPS